MAWGNQQDSIDYVQIGRKLYLNGIDLVREGKDIEAVDTFKLYLHYRKLAFGNEHYMLGSPYLGIGIAYKNLGQFNLALEYYKKAEKNYLLRNDPNIVSLGRLYRNIGNVFRAKLDYTNALNYFERALAIFSNQNPINPIDLADAHYAIAEIYYLINDYEKTIQILTENITKGDELNQIYYNELLAHAYQMLNNNTKALLHFQITLKIAESYYEQSAIELAIVYINYAEFLSSIYMTDECFKNLEKAKTILNTEQPFRGKELSMYYEILGRIFQEKSIETQQINKFKAQKKEYLNKAIKYYEKGLNALNATEHKINISTVRIEDCLAFLDCLGLLKQIGDVYHELALIDKVERTELYNNSLAKALEYYQATSRMTQQARREISSDESKIQLAELEYSTFIKTIETAYLAYDATGENKFMELAFNNAEQLKSSAVFDKLSNDLAQENSLIPDSLLQNEKKLNSIISVYTQKIFEENNSNETDSVLLQEYQKKIFDASRERDEFNRLLEEKYPDYYDLKYSNSMLSMEEIQKKMDTDEAIFEYVLVEPEEKRNDKATPAQLFIILITKNKSVFHKSTIDKNLQSSLEEVFNFMSDPNYIFTKNSDSKTFCVSSYKLYNLLIAPFENDLQNKDLVIIPDGKLNYISFDGLLKNMPDTSKVIDFTRLHYLLKEYNINYANSVNILFKNRSNSKNLTNRTLAFAPEYQSEKFEMSNASYTLMPLPGVQKEVDAIASTIKTKILRGTEASEQNFRKESKNYDILHLAMHAYINDSLPAFSRLAFAPQHDPNELTKDGWLNTTDIYNLDLKAKLTVLSACNTGVGKLKKGEGMMSLARGFLYAGCPSIIMSLWEVEDESGTQIMSSFYKNLKKGKTKDEALRLAKLSYLENSNSRLAHPHYWMSFKSIGDNSPIYTSYDVYFFVLLILLIVAFTADQTLRIKKARRKHRES
ncbi:CHAT domain-containing protein [Prolixibacteraceae bacterium Z1-6]|uniref:CHAT domain-containing protein n=1 Tax=Draconibacterium aestuarii TaxID=2998507 RepID=A0A9X3J6L6_9BACT|nr:CHAT domain-containing protein [Prolixibacteraceae bacterium Z1-6]